MAEAEKDTNFDVVRIRHPHTMEEREIAKGGLPFFVNQGYEVLTAAGNVSGAATNAAKKGD